MPVFTSVFHLCPLLPGKVRIQSSDLGTGLRQRDFCFRPLGDLITPVEMEECVTLLASESCILPRMALKIRLLAPGRIPPYEAWNFGFRVARAHIFGVKRMLAATRSGHQRTIESFS